MTATHVNSAWRTTIAVFTFSYPNTHIMRLKLSLLFLAVLALNCKQQPEPSKAAVKEEQVKSKTTSKESPIVKELEEFADLNPEDAATGVTFLLKEIDQANEVVEIDMDRAISLYSNLIGGNKIASFPIFEIQGTSMAILPVQGTGFGGALWARVLIDKTSLQIKKIAFEHKAESDGYGADITKKSFEDQFIDKKIDLDTDTFVLRQTMEKSNDKRQPIDGLSGATVSSQGVVQMINDGMKNYSHYLRP